MPISRATSSNAQWLGEILTQFFDGSDYAMSLSSNRGEMAHAMSLFADKQATSLENSPSIAEDRHTGFLFTNVRLF